MTANDHDQSFACLMSMAEHELGAFTSAVAGLYGSEQARISADDWIDELEAINDLTELAPAEWRRITIAAAVRFADRLTKLAVHPHCERRLFGAQPNSPVGSGFDL